MGQEPELAADVIEGRLKQGEASPVPCASLWDGWFATVADCVQTFFDIHVGVSLSCLIFGAINIS